MAKVNIKIDGIHYQVEEGLTILEAARRCGYIIPSLCNYNHGECSKGSCRVCLVETNKIKGLVASCVQPVMDGMEIKVSAPHVIEARRASIELILSNHNKDCQHCPKNGQCELLNCAKLTGARPGKFMGAKTPTTLEHATPSIVRDTSKCILCGRCIERCKNAHGQAVIGFERRGFSTFVSPAEGRSLADSPCILCGQCVSVCPTAALWGESEIEKVDELMKSGKHVIVQTAPAVRAALGEEFGYKIGTPVTGKMVAALRRMGFDKVYDVDFGADLTIMEEANELVERMKNGGVLPMITSCSPGWVNFAEYNYSDLLPHLSSCKSPHQMQGAILKSYYAKVNDLDPKEIAVVSVMPCTAKKYEKTRRQLRVNGIPDVDAVLTTRELATMIRRSGILFNALPDENYDYDIMGSYTGAGVIFGVTGGVMEAALRTVYHTLTETEKDGIIFEEVRGNENLREACIEIGDQKIWVAVACGMKSARVLLDEIRAGKSKYTFIEIMGCPGGCICGGGQPQILPAFFPFEEEDIIDTFREKRAKALYSEDERQVIRQSHNNPQIEKLYEKFLGKPGSEKAHELLHTSYEAREGFNDIPESRKRRI